MYVSFLPFWTGHLLSCAFEIPNCVTFLVFSFYPGAVKLWWGGECSDQCFQVSQKEV